MRYSGGTCRGVGCGETLKSPWNALFLSLRRENSNLLCYVQYFTHSECHLRDFHWHFAPNGGKSQPKSGIFIMLRLVFLTFRLREYTTILLGCAVKFIDWLLKWHFLYIFLQWKMQIDEVESFVGDNSGWLIHWCKLVRNFLRDSTP